MTSRSNKKQMNTTTPNTTSAIDGLATMSLTPTQQDISSTTPSITTTTTTTINPPSSHPMTPPSSTQIDNENESPPSSPSSLIPPTSTSSTGGPSIASSITGIDVGGPSIASSISGTPSTGVVTPTPSDKPKRVRKSIMTMEIVDTLKTNSPSQHRKIKKMKIETIEMNSIQVEVV